VKLIWVFILEYLFELDVSVGAIFPDVHSFERSHPGFLHDWPHSYLAQKSSGTRVDCAHL
jgi:hypothetical protein